tara:strand:+ start:1541 stop:1843 length:303 start_codon:yes stop_codon:yes gene_type:complete
MLKIDNAPDLNGRDLLRGDTVTTVGGGTTGKVKDIVDDEGALFVEVRPMYQASGKGVWHASDRLLWLSRPKTKADKPASDPRTAGKSAAAKAGKSVKAKK